MTSYTIYNVIVIFLGARSMSKSETVYEAIRERIVQGDFTAGYRLVIDALARDLQVSPIPVREALRRLEAEGLVRHPPYGSAEVVGIDDQQYQDMLEVLARLEGWAAGLASQQLELADLDELTHLAHQMNQALEASHLEQYAQLNRRFHAKILTRCPNPFLAELVQKSWARLDHVRHNLFVLIPERATGSLQDHYQIVQSLREHAPARVLEALVEEHHRRTLAAYQHFLAERRRLGEGGRPG